MSIKGGNADHKMSGLRVGGCLFIIAGVPFEITLATGWFVGGFAYLGAQSFCYIPPIKRAFAERLAVRFLSFLAAITSYFLAGLANGKNDITLYFYFGYFVLFIHCLIHFIEYYWTTGWAKSDYDLYD